MPKADEQRSTTLELAVELYGRGVRKMAVLVRHAARHYDPQHLVREPFLPLTDEGKQSALEFGLGLPSDGQVRFYSSALCRCVETAYQIEKGCIRRGARTTVNAVVRHLGPFFITDTRTVFARCAADGSDRFFDQWLSGEIPEDVMMSPRASIEGQLTPVLADLAADGSPRIDVNVTHDCNVYLIRQHWFGQRVQDAGPVKYLEGVILFEDNGTVKAANALARDGVALP